MKECLSPNQKKKTQSNNI